MKIDTRKLQTFDKNMKIGLDARHEIFIKVIEGDKSKRHMIANVNIIIARKLFHKIFFYIP